LDYAVGKRIAGYEVTLLRLHDEGTGLRVHGETVNERYKCGLRSER
jgi:hypothetical protein